MAQQTFTGRKRIRQFLMVDEPPGGRLDEGLQAVFRSVFPISDFSGTSMLEFVRYEFEPPKYDVDECRQRGMTYAAPLKVTLRLIVFDIDEETGAKSVKDIKEQDVYMGDIPLMTMNGTFVVDATRFRGYSTINDLIDADTGKVVLEAGKKLTVRGARQLQEKGLKALRLSDEELVGNYLAEDLVNPKTGEIYAEAGEEITDKSLKALNEHGYKELPLLDIDHVNV